LLGVGRELPLYYFEKFWVYFNLFKDVAPPCYSLRFAVAPFDLHRICFANRFHAAEVREQRGWFLVSKNVHKILGAIEPAKEDWLQLFELQKGAASVWRRQFG
jgi:hypothetical protein